MSFTRTPLFVHITDINKQINEHERLILVCKDKTASFAFKTFDIGTLFYRKEYLARFCQNNNYLHLLMKKTLFLQCLTDYLLQMSGSDLSKGLFYYTSKLFRLGG